MSIPPISSISNRPLFHPYENKLMLTVIGGELCLNRTIDDLDSEEFFRQLENLKNEPWDTYRLGNGQVISREKLLGFASLKLPLSFSDLIKLDPKVSIQNLQILALDDIEPIHKATYLGSIPLLEKILNEGGSLDALCSSEKAGNLSGHCPLSIAFSKQHEDVFEWLLSKGADPSLLKDFSSRFWDVAMKKPETWIPLFRKYDVASKIIAQDLDSTLFPGNIINNPKLIEFLLDCGLDIDLKNANFETLLSLAFSYKKFDLAKFLILRNAKVRDLGHAVMTGEIEIVRLLLEKKVGWSNSYFDNPIYIASEENNIEMIRLLAQYGLKAPKEMSWQLLKNPDLIKNKAYLFELNVLDVNAKNDEGSPLLHLALLKEMQELTELLIKSPDIDLKAVDSLGMSALHVAICRENLKATRLLLEKGADPNVQTLTSITPLHLAALLNSFQCVELLMKNHAKLEITDYEGLTPYKRLLLDPSPGFFMDSGSLFPSESRLELPPSMLLHLYKKTRIDVLKPHIQKLENEKISHWKEAHKKIYIAHLFNKKGNSFQLKRSEKKEFLEGKKLKSISLEGLSYIHWLHHQKFKQLNALSQNKCSENTSGLELLIDAARFSSDDFNHTNKDVLTRIEQDLPTIISSGFIGHATNFVFWKDLILICNSGGKSRTPVEVFRYKRGNLTEEIILKIRESDTKSDERYESNKMQFHQLLQMRQEKFEDNLEELLRAKIAMQSVGNCVSASFEASLSVLLILHKMQDFSLTPDWKSKALEGLKEYEFYLMNSQISSLSSYIDFHLSSKSEHYPDTALIEMVMSELKEILTNQGGTLREKFVGLEEKFKIFHSQFPPLPVKDHLSNPEAKDDEIVDASKLSYSSIIAAYIHKPIRRIKLLVFK